MKSAVWLVISVLALSGCVTTTSGRAADPERALSNYIQLGRNYLSEGERDQARFNLLKALEIDSRSPEANNVMALLNESEGEVELAKQAYRRALSSDTGYTPARMNLARVLFAEVDYAGAREQYLKSSEDVNYRLRGNAFYGLALTDLRLGQPERAKESLRRALQLNPSLASALLEVADISYQEQNYPLAMEYLERYESVASESPRSLELGILLARVFRDVNAEATYALALQTMFPDSREAREYQLTRD